MYMLRANLSDVARGAHAQLVGILVVQQHVGQERHHRHGEGERLRGVDYRQLQQGDHVAQHAHHRLVCVGVSATLQHCHIWYSVCQSA